MLAQNVCFTLMLMIFCSQPKSDGNSNMENLRSY